MTAPRASAMRVWRRRLLVGAVGVALVIGLFFGIQRVRAMWAQPPVPVHTVERTSFARKVTAEGNLKAVKATPLLTPRRSRQALKIAWLAVDGSRIKEGEVVARFDPTEMEKKLVDGQAALLTAQRKISKERIDIGSVQAERDRESEMTRLELEQTKKFQRKNAVIFSRNDIIESEIDGELSQARLEHAEAAEGIERSLSKSKLDLLAIEKRVATMQVEQAKEGLEGLTITAPHAGIVVLKRDWRGNEMRVGDQVWPGQPLAEIPHIEEMEAEVFVLEADAGGLVEGLSAEVVIEAHADRRFAADIKRVDKLAKPRVRGVPVQYFGVTLELEETLPDLMKPGQRVRATLTLDQSEALVVPRPAVFEKDGEKIVYRQTETGEFEPVEVKLGATSLGQVIIDEGISEGDLIALRDPTRPRSESGQKSDQEDGSEPGMGPGQSAVGGGR